MLPWIAAAHDGHDHQLDALAQLAPEAVGGACIRTIDVPGQGPSCRDDDTWLVDVPGARDIPTHGPDRAAATNFAPASLDAPAQAAVDNASVADVTCAANSRVPRYRLVYVHVTGGPYVAANVGRLRVETYRASSFLNQQAGASRAAKLRMLCDNGEAQVDIVEVSAGAHDFSTIAAAVQSTLQPEAEHSLERYIIYFEGQVDGYAGQGTMVDDERASVDNVNNDARAIAINYAGSTNAPRWDVILHEALHTMGSVQDGAPDATGSAHCTSEFDVMCYVDGPGVTLVTRCATLQVDCNRDSYFDTAETPASTYLRNNWNVGHWRNRWLDHGAANRDVTAPSRPGVPVVDAVTTTSVAVSWRISVDDSSSIHYRIEVGAGATTTAIPTYSFGSLRPGTAHTFRVVAVDAAGNESASNSVTASTLADSAPPTATPRPSVRELDLRSIGIGWGAATDNVAVGSYQVFRRAHVVQSWALATTVPASSRTAILPTSAPGEDVLVMVRAVDTSGNVGPDSPTLTTRSLTDTTRPTTPTVTSAILIGSTLQLSWNAATDDGGIGSYDIELVDGASRATVAQLGPGVLRYDITGLPKPRDVDVHLTAVDLVGNRSLAVVVHVRFPAEPAAGGTALPPEISVEQNAIAPIKHGTTGDDGDGDGDDDAPGLRDTTAPTRPMGLRVNKRTRYGVAIAWRPSNDAAGVTRYRVLLAGARGRWVTHRTVPARSAQGYAIPGLRPGRRYVVSVQALDAAGNASARSTAIRITTPRRR